MWLLKTETEPDGPAGIELKQFWGSVVKPYAILSHRWSTNPDDEVSFADVRYLARPRPEDDYERQIILAKPGYRKLIQAIRKARSDGWQYIWIDTCCIDKDSSVALSEAINSMYRYYQQSAVCYAHLADVIQVEDLEASVYFKRGWTLQELLAPNNLVFTNKDWTNIGTKQSLAHRVSMCTNIPKDYLLHHSPISHASIAERMSWAADRELSREEDVAYSLLGLFNVNMYQLYGEGRQRAFQRLQEEILKQNDEDQTIFAWNKPSSSNKPFPTAETVFQEGDYHGLLADGPEDFRACGGMQVLQIMSISTPPTMTARGLQLSLPLTAKTNRLAIATLYCPAAQVPNGLFGLYLLQLDDKPNSYVRVCCDIKIFLYEPDPGPPKNLYVVQNYVSTPRNAMCPFHRLQLKHVRGFDARGTRMYLETKTREGATGPYSDRPRAYRINKQPNVVSASVSVREFNRERGFEIAFASIPDAELSWTFPGSNDEGAHWKPRRSGSTVTLSWCKVTVWIEEDIDGDTKWFTAKVEVRIVDERSSVTVMDKQDKGGGGLRTGFRKLVSGKSAS